LLWSFATRDYKVRYAQTLLGYGWSIIQPLASVAVLFLVFKKMMGIEAEGIGYLPYVMSGLLLWNYFNFVISQSASALLNAQNMIRKIYFPKICLPLSKAIVGLVAPLVGFLILILLISQESNSNWWGLLFFFPALIITSFASMGIGLWASALSIRFRDLQQIIPYVLQILFFLTPIAYSSKLANSLVPESMEFILYLNPMTGIIESYRSLLFGTMASPFIWISYAMSLLLFISSLRYFQKIEMKIADII
jgi:lipopolysaccharide transport system permease protein